jgi:hypothetical protein
MANHLVAPAGLPDKRLGGSPRRGRLSTPSASVIEPALAVPRVMVGVA